MATEKIITRTITSLSVNVLGFGENNEVLNPTLTIPEMDSKKILPYITANFEGFTPAKVLKVDRIEELYGMPESLFRAYATKMPPRKDYNNKGEG